MRKEGAVLRVAGVVVLVVLMNDSEFARQRLGARQNYRARRQSLSKSGLAPPGLRLCVGVGIQIEKLHSDARAPARAV